MMSQEYTRKSAYEWEWTARAGRYHGVRYFPETRRLIWSGWRTMSDGLHFDDGYAQSADDFLASGINHLDPPAGLVTELTQVIQGSAALPERRWFQFWKWGS